MKKLLLFFFVVFLSHNLCNASDSNNIPKQKPLWKTTLSYYNWQDMFPVVMKTPDGLLVAGISHHKGDITAYEYKVVLWKLDEQGKELWVKDINLPAWQKDFIPVRCYAINDERSLFVTVSPGSKSRRAWIINLDNNGDIVSSVEFSEKLALEAERLIKINDGFLLYGSTMKGREDFDAFLTKTDFNGNQIWHHEYNKGKMDYVMDIALQEDRSLILGIDSGIYNKFGSGPSNAWIIKCSPDGNILNEITFEGRHPSVVSSGNVTAVIFNKENFPQQDIAVIGLDNNLKVLWRIESLYGKAGGANMMTAIVNQKGNFVLGGDIVEPLSASSTTGLWEINKEGKILSAVEIEDNNSNLLFQCLEMPNGYIVAGSFTNMSKMLTPEGKIVKGVERDSMDIFVAKVSGSGN